ARRSDGGSAGMSRRIVLCEGPDDVAALREIATGIFRAVTPASAGRTDASTSGAAGQARGQVLLAGRARIEIRAVKTAKSQLAKAVPTEVSINLHSSLPEAIIVSSSARSPCDHPPMRRCRSPLTLPLLGLLLACGCHRARAEAGDQTGSILAGGLTRT